MADKMCVDCKHCIRDFFSVVFGCHEFTRCRLSSRNPVTGNHKLCTIERLHYGCLGSKFEQRSGTKE